jgi:hypothetical protein
VRHKDGVRFVEGLNELGQDVFDDRLFPDHSLGNVVNLLDVQGNGSLRIDELLEGGELAHHPVEGERLLFRPAGAQWEIVPWFQCPGV